MKEKAKNSDENINNVNEYLSLLVITDDYETTKLMLENLEKQKLI